MIIDDDYSQYEMFRIINKAGVDARAQFEMDVQKAADDTDKQAMLAQWQQILGEEQADEQSTEESVYSLEYARIMVQCWEKA